MPSDVQVMLASSLPMVPLESALPLQIDVVDLDVGLHTLGVFDVVSGGVDGDVVVVTAQVLQQEWARAERHGGAVLDDARGRGGHDAVGSVPGIEFPADQAGDTQRRDDDQHQDDRHGVTTEAEAALGFRGLAGVLRRRLIKRLGGRVLLRRRRVRRDSRLLILGLRRRLGGRIRVAGTRPGRRRVLVWGPLRIRHLGDSALSG